VPWALRELRELRELTVLLSDFNGSGMSSGSRAYALKRETGEVMGP
jgi:hypothetical protein